MLKKLLWLLVLLISSQAMAEKIYKWVDENGQIHYSSSKPVNQEVETVKVKKGPKIVPKAEPEATENQSEGANEAGVEDETAEAAARAQLAAADKVNNKKQCDLARNNLNALNASVKISRKNEQGELVRMSDQQRVKAMQTAQQGIRQYCK